MANEFNDFFVNVASKIKEPLINTNHDKLESSASKCKEAKVAPLYISECLTYSP